MMKFISNFALALMFSVSAASTAFAQELLQSTSIDPIQSSSSATSSASSQSTVIVSVNVGHCAELVQVYRKGACLAATEYLSYLRSGTIQYKYFTQYLRKELEAGGLALKDIRTSEDELAELQIKGAKKSATEWLTSLRKGTTQYKAFVDYVRQDLNVFNLPLSAIGTTEAELAELRVKGAKMTATEYLSYLRSGTIQYKYFTQYLRKELEAGGLTPEDIGSSEFELQEHQSKS